MPHRYLQARPQIMIVKLFNFQNREHVNCKGCFVLIEILEYYYTKVKSYYLLQMHTLCLLYSALRLSFDLQIARLIPWLSM